MAKIDINDRIRELEWRLERHTIGEVDKRILRFKGGGVKRKEGRKTRCCDCSDNEISR
jgi:hypothetical protein